MNWSNLVRVALPLALLGAGAFGAQAIVKSRPQAARAPHSAAAPVVELEQLRAEPRRALIMGSGIVTPAHELRLTPQVSGAVTYVSPRLVPGSRVKAGEVLVRIDAREYELAVEQQRGALRSAELQIEQEQARQQLAEHEWQALGERGMASALFSRQSQLEAAKAAHASSGSALERARLNLARATLQAPFDASVVEKTVDVGQVVSPGTQLGYLVGTQEIWVVVSVRLDELPLLSVPGVAGFGGAASEANASRATVSQQLGHGSSVVRQGRVARLVEQLDERTRRARLVVVIEDALSTEKGLPLLPGAMVRVELVGKPFEAVYQVPRTAVYDGNTVWLMDDHRLEKRKVDVVWGDQEHVYVTTGLSDGEQLVVSRLSRPLEGLEVQSAEEARQRRAHKPEADAASTTKEPVR